LLSSYPMPTYEYKCPKGHVFEKFFPTISNKRKVACPPCGKSGSLSGITYSTKSSAREWELRLD